ncbi:MAG: ribonuclease H-like domain-containing protein [Proteobacteria bacterium]|nr:ribonuclease H-like domain-containing protein [Pseudomonadota bacterium]
MSVISRLQRLTGEGSKESGGRSKAEQLSRLRERIDAVLSRRPEGRKAEAPPSGRGRGVPLGDLVPGVETTNEAGAFFCVNRVAGGSSRHGERCIRDLAPLDMERLAILANDPVLRGLDYRQALFLDTETTGLAGGTGTVAFLIGLGWFEEGGFVTRQLFARDYAEERATLLCLTELLRGKRFLVSFNGKAFDANLLAARFIMNRLPDPLAGLPHLDLLHPARRLLSHRLSDRRLGALEVAVLGFEREGDIPGSEIPQRYFDWLRLRDGRLMADVFEHNRLDILSLAALAAQLAELLDPDGENARCHPGDRLAAARLFLARSCPYDAVRRLVPLIGGSCPETAREAGRELSLVYKRSDQWPAAVAIWEEMVRRDGEDLFALVELAKWCEHRRRDFAQALVLTMRACACAGRLSPDDRADLARRRERLERKLASWKAVK